MNNSDCITTRLRLLSCILLYITIMLIILVLPDYVRSMECTQFTYATVVSVEPCEIMCYDYVLKTTDITADDVIYINSIPVEYKVGEYVKLEYNDDKTMFRIPNSLY